jgi:hypothetical protein
MDRQGGPQGLEPPGRNPRWRLDLRHAHDFRGPPGAPGSKGEYAKTTLHAGLVCLKGPNDGFDLDTQRELFAIALDEIDREPDLTNQVLETTLEATQDETITISRYDLPASAPTENQLRGS